MRSFKVIFFVSNFQMKRQDLSVVVVAVFLFIISTAYVTTETSSSCNEAICGSIVSKCMLTQSCKCEAKNTSCSKDCFYCLDYLYTECCSCVEMCPKVNDTDNFLSEKSHVEDLVEPIPDLFALLTEEKDRLLRWTTYTFPTQASFITMDKEVKFIAAKSITDDTTTEEVQMNCTVAFMSQCMSWNKCKNSCSSMGASSYRWFHDGCCECVGSICVNYGINESRCLECPPDKDLNIEEHQSLDENETYSKEKPEKKALDKEEEDEKADDPLIEKDKEPVEKMQSVDAF